MIDFICGRIDYHLLGTRHKRPRDSKRWDKRKNKGKNNRYFGKL